MHPILRSSFDQVATSTFDKQLFLNETVGDLDWEFDMDEGVLCFGTEHQWHAEILGSESERSQTWLWGWANEASGIPEDLLVSARSLYELGKREHIEEFTQSQLTLEEVDGHFWSILATGLCQAVAYYRGPYEGGAVYLLIKDERYPLQSCDRLSRLAEVLPQAILSYPIQNHLDALIGYAEYLDLSVTPNEDGLVVSDSEGGELSAEFDDDNRLTKLSGSVM